MDSFLMIYKIKRLGATYIQHGPDELIYGICFIFATFVFFSKNLFFTDKIK